MTDLNAARANMVASQVRANDVTDPRIQEAMGALPRELFVPRAVRALAYASESVPIGNGRGLMEPRTFAKLAHAARVMQGDVALVVGAGCGYDTAVLAKLAETVVAVEEDEDLRREADMVLTRLGIDNAVMVAGLLTEGFSEQAPYDVIFIDGSVEVVPPALFVQLRDKGRLAVVEQDGPIGRARIYTRSGTTVSGRTVFDGAAPGLPGFARAKEFSF